MFILVWWFRASFFFNMIQLFILICCADLILVSKLVISRKTPFYEYTSGCCFYALASQQFADSCIWMRKLISYMPNPISMLIQWLQIYLPTLFVQKMLLISKLESTVVFVTSRCFQVEVDNKKGEPPDFCNKYKLKRYLYEHDW